MSDSTPTGAARGAWVPDACTLPTLEQPVRLAEFDDFFTTKLRSQTRLDQDRLRWTLHPDAEATARDLAARESSCCSFFTFTFSAAAELEESPDQHSDDVVLEVSVPPAHIEVLAALAQRADTLIGRV